MPDAQLWKQIAYPMLTYIAATDAAFEWFDKLRKTDISKALAGFLSLRFTAGIPANLLMSYSADPGKSPGRCYLEIFSLFSIYDSIQEFDEVVGPVQEESINMFQVRDEFLANTFLPLTSLYRGVSIGANILHQHSRLFSIRSTMSSSLTAFRHSRRLQRNSIQTTSCGMIL